MPVVFIGHGSPMNAIEVNEFTLNWKRIAQSIPKPKGILVISAHYETYGLYITSGSILETIYDFGGFPQILYDQTYIPQTSKDLVEFVESLYTHDTSIVINHDKMRGIDHGAWSVLLQMYPHANIPTIQLSLNRKFTPTQHFEFAKKLQSLRDEGYLVLCSGNMVHNFEYLEFKNGFTHEFGHDWAIEADAQFVEDITHNNIDSLLNYEHNPNYKLAAPTPEHYLPMLYALAQRTSNDTVEFFNQKLVAGSFSMTSFVIGG